MTARGARALLLACLAAVLLPAICLAHPLGNFTINHYAGLRLEPDRVLLDVVIDQAEIPAFQARQELDLDEDGEVSETELERGRKGSCTALGAQIRLTADGAALTPSLMEAGLELRPGVGGLSTLRLVCGFEAALPAPIETSTMVEFADTSHPGRLGWREIVVEASGVAASSVDRELRTSSLSDRLLAYPEERLDDALDDGAIAILVKPGGDALPPFDIPDAAPIDEPGAPRVDVPSAPAAPSVPGGVGGEIPALFQTADLTPAVLLLSMLTAVALGAGHALTPGHGKTLMAAYLVGSRGTPIHAVGLGLSVSVSHTLGILALAALVIGAQGAISPDLVIRVAPIIAAVTIVGIGGWMLVGELRGRLAARRERIDHDELHAAGSAHEHHHDDHDHADHGTHRHGGLAHSHVPNPGSSISWRSLFVLGLAGGLVPSTSALLILLGAIAAGRPAFGLVLVVAFGLGMAIVMAGVGLVLLLARGRLEGAAGLPFVGSLREWLPLAAACVVLGIGGYLTIQAVTAAPTL